MLVLDLAASIEDGGVIDAGSQACDRDSGLGPKIAEEFGQALKQNSFVTQLDMSGQRIGDEGARRLACKALARSSAVRATGILC